MTEKKKLATQVWAFPADPEACKRFNEGVHALAEECGVELVAGSTFNELTWIDTLEALHAEETHRDEVNDARVAFERNQMGLSH